MKMEKVKSWLKGFRDLVRTAFMVLVLLSAAVGAWQWVTDGSLIKWLGGAVVADITSAESGRLQCTALPAEETQPPRQCGAGQFKLVEWCSGDCNSDDARVTICCSQSGESEAALNAGGALASLLLPKERRTCFAAGRLTSSCKRE